MWDNLIMVIMLSFNSFTGGEQLVVMTSSMLPVLRY